MSELGSHAPDLIAGDVGLESLGARWINISYWFMSWFRCCIHSLLLTIRSCIQVQLLCYSRLSFLFKVEKDEEVANGRPFVRDRVRPNSEHGSVSTLTFAPLPPLSLA